MCKTYFWAMWTFKKAVLKTFVCIGTIMYKYLRTYQKALLCTGPVFYAPLVYPMNHWNCRERSSACILHGMMAENGTYHKYDQLICRNRSKTILEQWFGKIYIDIHNIGYSMNGKLRLLISCQHFWKNNLFIYYFNYHAMLMLLWKFVFDDHNEIGHYKYY